jgi:PKD repeat protein
VKTEAGKKGVYRWDFGDGNTAEGEVVSHMYPKGSNYRIQLTVEMDGRSERYEIPVIVNAPPVLVATHEPKVCVNDDVVFSAEKSWDPNGDSLTFLWDFGDGQVAEKSGTVSHRYASVGNYAVKVTVSDGRGMSCSNTSQVFPIRVNASPVAKGGGDRQATVHGTVFFEAKDGAGQDGDTLSYLWNFGDGHAATGRNVSHVYGREGQYRVVLKVDNGSGTSCATQSDSFVVDVVSAPAPKIA